MVGLYGLQFHGAREAVIFRKSFTPLFSECGNSVSILQACFPVP